MKTEKDKAQAKEIVADAKYSLMRLQVRGVCVEEVSQIISDLNKLTGIIESIDLKEVNSP